MGAIVHDYEGAAVVYPAMHKKKFGHTDLPTPLFSRFLASCANLPHQDCPPQNFCPRPYMLLMFILRPTLTPNDQ